MGNYYSDLELINQLKKNNFSAQMQLMRVYASKLTAFAMKFGLSREDAVDVVNQSLQKVMEKIETYEPGKGTKFSTWIYQITKNTIIDSLRQIQYEQEESGGPLESVEKLIEDGYQIGSIETRLPSDDEESDLEEVEHEILQQALENLNIVDRKVLLEWAYGASFKEIGQLINKKEGTAKVIKHRALDKLEREYLRVLTSQDEGIQEILKARYPAIRGRLS